MLALEQVETEVGPLLTLIITLPLQTFKLLIDEPHKVSRRPVDLI
jgi:hypothetical protein